VIPAEDPFDASSYYALLRINMKVAAVSFPELRER
jgi:hypothetical protein